jgi:hypothetical protein
MSLVVHFRHLRERAKVGEVDNVGFTHSSTPDMPVWILDFYDFQHRTVPEEVEKSVEVTRQVPVIALAESESKVREVRGPGQWSA